MDRLLEFLASFDPDQPTFPPTQLYNEGWLLRLALDWLARNPLPGFPLDFAPGATWFSEALLPSPFRPRYRGDPLSESRTHADGVVGHIAVGQEGKADLALAADAPPGTSQLLVLEAKLSSGLSAGTKNAPDYDQAARNVACMAEVLWRAGRRPADLASLGFYVLAPQARVEAGVFASQLTRESILHKVARRTGRYEGEQDVWFRDSFRPLIETVALGALSWEEILARIADASPSAAASLTAFYERCLRFN